MFFKGAVIYPCRSAGNRKEVEACERSKEGHGKIEANPTQSYSQEEGGTSCCTMTSDQPPPPEGGNSSY